jgi:hypothetical protein
MLTGLPACFDGVDMGRTVKFVAGGILVIGAVAVAIIYANWDALSRCRIEA